MNYSNQKITFSVTLFVIFLCSAFGANVVAVKISMTGVGILTIAFIRFFMAAIVISLWAFFTGKVFKVEKKYFKQLLILSIIFTVQLALFYYGISKTSATHAVLLANTQPFFILFLAHFFIPNDKINLKKILGIIFGFMGVMVVFLGKGGGFSEFHVGDIIMVLVSFIWGANAVYMKRIIHNFQPFHLVLYPMIFALPFYFIGGYLFDEKMIFLINWEIFLSLIYQGVVTASFGFIAWITFIKKYGVVTLHTYLFVMPVSGIIFSWLILNEPIGYNIISAMIFIALGIVIINMRKGLFYRRNPKKLEKSFKI